MAGGLNPPAVTKLSGGAGASLPGGMESQEGRKDRRNHVKKEG